METKPKVVTECTNKEQIWCVLVDDMRNFSYQYIPHSDGYIFKGTEEQAKNLFIKLFLEKYNEKYKVQPPFKTLKEYFDQEYYFDDMEDEEIKKNYENLYLLERSDERLNGYMLSDKALKQFPGIKYTSIDITDYF